MSAALGRWGGLVVGLSLTSASLSSGFIWACGSPCLDDPIVWTARYHEPLVFLAAFAAWWGYLLAHYAWTGTFIDASAHDEEERIDGTNGIERAWPRRIGVAVGVAILISGMVIGVLFIRQGNHLLTNVGGVLFLGGFVVAHYAETGKPL